MEGAREVREVCVRGGRGKGIQLRKGAMSSKGKCVCGGYSSKGGGP